MPRTSAITELARMLVAGGISTDRLERAPTVDDVRSIALPVLRHRLLPNHRAVGDGVNSDQIVERLLKDVK